jgi:hypothetical protein
MAAAKKVLRVVTASEDIAPIIDQGAEVNTELTNLTYRDKGLKAKITAAAAGEIEEGEKSIKMEGDNSVAVVTASERFELDFGSEAFSEVESAIKSGMLDDVITTKRTLMVPGGKIDEALAALQKAGVQASVDTKYVVSPGGYREFSDEGSPERAQVKDALDSCVGVKTTYRVKYE